MEQAHNVDEVNQSQEQVLKIGLISGARFHVRKIFLQEESYLRKAQDLRISAANELGGSGNITGVIGSPEWVLAGAMVLGALQTLAASRSASASLAKLKEADQLSKLARTHGTFIPIIDIDGVNSPDPGTWRGLVARGEHRSFVHDGSPFVHALTDEEGFVLLAWEKVEIYSPPTTPQLSDEQKMTKFGIVFDGMQYRYSGMSYAQLADAIGYAELQSRQALGTR